MDFNGYGTAFWVSARCSASMKPGSLGLLLERYCVSYPSPSRHYSAAQSGVVTAGPGSAVFYGCISQARLLRQRLHRHHYGSPNGHWNADMKQYQPTGTSLLPLVASILNTTPTFYRQTIAFWEHTSCYSYGHPASGQSIFLRRIWA